MAPLAMDMVRDIDEDTVDFQDNYDGRTQEPTILPSRIPNLLVNGSIGIAVGMATNIPPHNLREVAYGAIWALENPEATQEELLAALMQRIKAAGSQIMLHPLAHATHLYEHHPGKDSLIAQGWVTYAKKHFSSVFHHTLLRFISMCPAAQVKTFDATLQKSTESITLTVDPDLQEAWLLEISPNPDFYPSIGRFGSGPTVDIGAELI